ncbi:MFS transporter [Amycolatopsis thermophila]|uniref:MFS family arabinose efflux permease n=1 Tax=Amycolatopsis thermophila TaxID=206084 RepID=A0ABU0ERW7_9PSEU|nr:MFS transporter [Amycolatopsis thermophila]MDQ0377858.1 putative MFS family arabinose efflux permease [Amycolatopsis thermophila]
MVTTSRLPARVGVLTLATFAVGTDAFVVNGVLPELARSLGVSIGEAGQLVSVFALAYAVLSPVLAAVTGNWPRRTVLLAALGVFVVGNAVTALAPGYGLALASRVIAAAGAAAITPTASTSAAALAPAHRRGRAMSLVTLGLVSSTALGVPIGTLLGTVASWRETMWLVAALGVVAAAGVALWLPPVPNPPVTGLRARLAPLRDRTVVLVLSATVSLFTGIYLVTIYLSVIVEDATGGDGVRLTVLLFAAGVAGTISNVVTGGWTDRFGPARVITVAMALGVLDFALMPWTSATFAGALIAVVVYGLVSWSVMVPQQHQLIEAAPATPALVVSLNASAIYLAVSVAGVLGAGALRFAPGARLAWVAAVFLLLGLAATRAAAKFRR